VKALADYIGDCREQLGRYDDEESRKSAIYEDINWLFEEAQADLAYYRQIKTDIALFGVEEAMRRSSRRVAPPSADAPHTGPGLRTGPRRPVGRFAAPLVRWRWATARAYYAG